MTDAIDYFLGECDRFTILADLNRFASAGRKLYLINQASESGVSEEGE